MYKYNYKNFFYLIKKFHSNLLIKGNLGKNIVGIYAAITIFMIVSGLILWLPKTTHFIHAIKFKFTSKGKKFYRDLHASIGFWSAFLLLISSFSGLYLSFPKATTSLINMIFSGRDLHEFPKIILNAKDDLIKVDDAIKMSSENDKKFFSIIFPNKNDQPYRLNFIDKDGNNDEPMSIIFVDQWQKKIIEKRDPKLYSTGEKITSWQHNIHEGKGFGIIFQISVFLLGFLPIIFAITGIKMWMLKTKKIS
jgi:uncharacterized iron-regulated membrane protein